MKIIKLTSVGQGKPNDVESDIYINIDHIGHIYEVNEEKEHNILKTIKHTRVGVITHNNGGFKVKESWEEIKKALINC